MQSQRLRRFQTLRWKLTWSYVWVTLVITMILNCVAFMFIAIYNPLLTPARIQRTAEGYAQDLQTLWKDGQPEQEKLQTALTYRFVELESQQVLKTQPMNVASFQFPTSEPQEFLVLPESAFEPTTNSPTSPTAQILVLNTDQLILAGTFPQDFVPGTRLSDDVLAPEIQASLAQGIAASTRITATQQLQTIVPIEPNDPDTAWLLIQTNPVYANRLFIFILVAIMYAVSMAITLVSNGIIGLIFGFFAARPYVRRLQKLTEASQSVAQGDFSPRIDDPRRDEIAQLGQQFNWMTDQLAANLKSLRQLADHNAALAEQAAQLATVEERNRLARELHDSVSQELFSVTMLAAAAENVIESNPTRAQEHLVQLRQMAQRALQETRALIFALRPAALGNQGLIPALRQLIEGIRDRQGLQVQLQINGERRLSIEQEQALFRITQEALANVSRHSGARSAEVYLEYTDTTTQLTVHDQGKGFDPNAQRSAQSLGLMSIQERVAALDGTLTIESTPGQGTTLHITVPRP